MNDTKPTVDPRIERTRQTVLEATVDLVAECGFGKTTIEAIAERSGVARSTIYRHWPQRPELLIEAVKTQLGEMPDPNTGNLRDDLVYILTSVARWFSDPQLGSLAASLMAEAKRDSDIGVLHAEMTRQRRHGLAGVIRRAVDRKEIPETVDTEQLAHDLAAPIFYRTFITHEPVDEPFVRHLVDRWLGIALDS